MQQKLNNTIHSFPNVFQPGLGTIKSITAELEMKDGVQPKFCKARLMSYALQESVEAEYNRLETEGIVDLEKVEFGEWATPMVHVPIAGGSTHQPPTQCPTVSNPIA